MIKLTDGRTELWQWDTGRSVTVDEPCAQVHFANKTYGRSYDVDVQDGSAKIPDILLQSYEDLKCWAFVGEEKNGYTKIEKDFKVNKRNKPNDYVFTETEQLSMHDLQNQIGSLDELKTQNKNNLVEAINEVKESGGGSGGASTAAEVSYTNTALPDVSNVKGALDTIAETQQSHEDDINTLGDKFTELDEEAHTHDNKSVLDKITAEKTAEWDGKSDFSGSYNDLTDKPTIPTVPTALKNPYALTVDVDGAETSYDGSAAKTVAVRGATKQVTTGTAITLADNTEYRLTDVATLTLTYPEGNFECWMSLTFAASGTVTVTLPTGTTYLGFVPVFKNGETWELSIKDGVIVAQGVVDGSAAQIEIVEDGTEVSY